ncbi:hypothetical protein, partial [Caballeronia novacaledonica]|uniref:hypothetical protein n=1 Tax=Caballeronia novacaledonica TaxID=1544861 RepID=UPI001EE38477
IMISGSRVNVPDDGIDGGFASFYRCDLQALMTVSKWDDRLLWLAKSHSPFPEADIHLRHVANDSKAKWSNCAVTERRMAAKADLRNNLRRF